MPRVSAERLDARRQEILAAARQAFAAHGYEGATVRVLEESTGLSRGAIFHHFKDKDALFLALAEQDAAAMAATVADSGLVQVMRDLPDRDPAELGLQLEVARRLRTDAAFRTEWQRRLQRVNDAALQRLRRGQEADTVRRDVAPETLLAFLGLLYDGLLVHLSTGRPSAQVTAVLDLAESAVRRSAATSTRPHSPHPVPRRRSSP